MKTLCYSVRVQSIVSISDKAVKITSFDGSCDILPKSQIFGADYDVGKSEAYWISAWILKQKKIQYSSKKSAFFDERGNRLPSISIIKHHPEKIEEVSDNSIEELRK